MTNDRREQPNADRIQYILSGRWIGYTRAKEALEILEDVYNHPKVLRMPNVLVAGETNSGKTSIVERFTNIKLSEARKLSPPVHVPIVLVQMPSTPDQRGFLSAILSKLNAPHNIKSHPDYLYGQMRKIFLGLGVRLLILDEVHHLIAGAMKSQRGLLNIIKFMGNDLQIPLVAVGTEAAYNAIALDPQMANRFEPLHLPRWRFNEEFLQLLVSFERSFPLREQSNLAEEQLARKILTLSEGILGEISTLLCRAAKRAIETGEEKISIRQLSHLRWTMPSERSKLPRR